MDPLSLITLILNFNHIPILTYIFIYLVYLGMSDIDESICIIGMS